MHVTYSNIIVGAAIFAGGPYHCAQGIIATAMTSCMLGIPSPSTELAVAQATLNEELGLVSPLKLLSNSRVYLFSGTLDKTVYPAVMNVLHRFYRSLVPSSQVYYENTIPAAHTQPTDDPAVTNPCGLAELPYLSNCGFDGAGHALRHIYGPLVPRNTGSLSGRLIAFDQTEFAPFFDTAALSLNHTGYVYVPGACLNRTKCRVHVSFHGCLQSFGVIGNTYMMRSGYIQWADTNRLIVLFPQTIISPFLPYNPKGCWDWWGYLDQQYDTRNGRQSSVIRSMLARLAGLI